METPPEEICPSIESVKKQARKLRAGLLALRIERLGFHTLKSSCYLSDSDADTDDDSTDNVEYGPSLIPEHFRHVCISVRRHLEDVNKNEWYVARISSARSAKKLRLNRLTEPLFPIFRNSANPGSATAFVGSVAYTIAGTVENKYNLTDTVTCFDVDSDESIRDRVKLVSELDRERTGAVAVGYKGKLYIFGGIHANTNVPKALRKTDMRHWLEVYDPKDFGYVPVSVPPGSLADIDGNFTAVAVEKQGKILLIGIVSGKLHRLYNYFPESDRWETVSVVIPRVDEKRLAATAVPRVSARGRGGVHGRRLNRLLSDESAPRVKISNAVYCGPNMVYWYYLGLYAYDMKEGWVASTQIDGLEDAGVRMSGDPDGSYSDQIENFMVALLKGSWRSCMLLCFFTLQACIVQATKFMVRKNEDGNNSIQAYYVDEESFLLDPCSKIMSVNVKDWIESPSDEEEEHQEEGQTSEESLSKQEEGSHDHQETVKAPLEETKQVLGSSDQAITPRDKDDVNREEDVVPAGTSIDLNIAAGVEDEMKEDQAITKDEEDVSMEKDVLPAGSSRESRPMDVDIAEGVEDEMKEDQALPLVTKDMTEDQAMVPQVTSEMKEDQVVVPEVTNGSSSISSDLSEVVVPETMKRLKWQKPARGRYKLNVHTAYFEQEGRQSIGAIIRNHDGEVLAAVIESRTRSRPMDVRLAEASGVLYALMWARDCLFTLTDLEIDSDRPATLIELEIDSMEVYRALKSEQDGSSPFGEVVWESHKLISSVEPLISVSHCTGVANVAARTLARMVRGVDQNIEWLMECPVELQSIVTKDAEE